MTDSTPTVIVVGAAARDIAAGDRRGWRLGGGVSYSALTTARLGLATGALIGVDDPATQARELDLLREAGVDVRLVRLARGPIFDNIETPQGRVQVCFQPSDPIPVRALPADWASAGAWIFGSVAGELPAPWASAVPPDALVATGWQGLLRDLATGERVRHMRPGPSRLIARSDFVGVSRDDLDADVSLHELCRLLHPGATLALTQGAEGGMTMIAAPSGATHLRRYPAIRSEAIVDPTGAGDVFLAALLAANAEPRLVGGRLDRGFDLLLAAAVSSLVLEAPGLLGVPERSAVRRRMAEGVRLGPHADAATPGDDASKPDPDADAPGGDDAETSS